MRVTSSRILAIRSSKRPVPLAHPARAARILLSASGARSFSEQLPRSITQK
jgi:hypothetical protein